MTDTDQVAVAGEAQRARRASGVSPRDAGGGQRTRLCFGEGLNLVDGLRWRCGLQRSRLRREHEASRCEAAPLLDPALKRSQLSLGVLERPRREGAEGVPWRFGRVRSRAT